tara:strand:+ start:352 stop:750 length:399 start_codon:yes stop_codon:yes gene_type:complete
MEIQMYKNKYKQDYNALSEQLQNQQHKSEDLIFLTYLGEMTTEKNTLNEALKLYGADSDEFQKITVINKEYADFQKKAMSCRNSDSSWSPVLKDLNNFDPIYINTFDEMIEDKMDEIESVQNTTHEQNCERN